MQTVEFRSVTPGASDNRRRAAAAAAAAAAGLCSEKMSVQSPQVLHRYPKVDPVVKEACPVPSCICTIDTARIEPQRFGLLSSERIASTRNLYAFLKFPTSNNAPHFAISRSQQCLKTHLHH
jgi:hypothetical protein